jgi:hypothetical protein
MITIRGGGHIREENGVKKRRAVEITQEMPTFGFSKPN